tara:strand:+ start:211 stop:486 length:276 start_codon:yes stop_codon:yes gene_type:complete
MSKINESALSNLVSVLAGAAIGDYLGKRFTSKGKPSEKAAKKILDDNPELAKAAKEMEDKAKDLEKRVKKVVSRLSPEQKARFDKISKMVG